MVCYTVVKATQIVTSDVAWSCGVHVIIYQLSGQTCY